MSEMKKAFDTISKMKEGDVINIKVRERNNDTSKVLRTIKIDKNMAEFLMRYMAEVPSRLNEIAIEEQTQTQKKISRQTEDILEAGEKEIAEIQANLDKAKELEGKNQFDKKQAAMARTIIDADAEEKRKSDVRLKRSNQSAAGALEKEMEDPKTKEAVEYAFNNNVEPNIEYQNEPGFPEVNNPNHWSDIQLPTGKEKRGNLWV